MHFHCNVSFCNSYVVGNCPPLIIHLYFISRKENIIGSYSCHIPLSILHPSFNFSWEGKLSIGSLTLEKKKSIFCRFFITASAKCCNPLAFLSCDEKDRVGGNGQGTYVGMPLIIIKRHTHTHNTHTSFPETFAFEEETQDFILKK